MPNSWRPEPTYRAHTPERDPRAYNRQHSIQADSYGYDRYSSYREPDRRQEGRRYAPPRDHYNPRNPHAPPEHYNPRNHYEPPEHYPPPGGGAHAPTRRRNAYQANQRQDIGPPPSSDFTFRAPDGPEWPRKSGYQPSRFARYHEDEVQDRRDRHPRDPHRDHHNRHGRGGGRRPPPPAHTRDILHKTGGGNTPEQLAGMNDSGYTRFGSISSGHASDGEEGRDKAEKAYAQFDEQQSDSERPAKKARTVAEVTPQASAIPKWSNPDFYTSLPAQDTVTGPKKDIIGLIRKARKPDSLSQTTPANAVVNNVDFISFNGEADNEADKNRPIRAPTGPRAMQGVSSKHVTPEARAASISLKTLANSPPSAAVAANRAASSPLVKDESDHLPRLQPIEDNTQPQLVVGPNSHRKEAGAKRKHLHVSGKPGGIVPEWRAPPGMNPTPWFTPQRNTASPHQRLNDEIRDFYNFVKPLEHEDDIRHALVRRVETAIQTFSAEARGVVVKIFGSFASNIHLPTSDLDLVALSPNFAKGLEPTFCVSSSQLHRLGHHLRCRSNLVARNTLNVISKARVPIIKFTDALTGIKVDISFDSYTGLVAVISIQRWRDEFPTLTVLVLLVKQMLAMRNLNEVNTGGLGGFSTVCIVTSMLQLLPEMQLSIMNPQTQLADLFMAFLDLYGNKFDYEANGIEMEPSPGYFDKTKNPPPLQNPKRLTIVNPNPPHNDISGGSNNIQLIFDVFAEAHDTLVDMMENASKGITVDGSMLGRILGGNYSGMIQQREHLRNLAHPQPSGKPVIASDKNAHKNVPPGTNGNFFSSPNRPKDPPSAPKSMQHNGQFAQGGTGFAFKGIASRTRSHNPAPGTG